MVLNIMQRRIDITVFMTCHAELLYHFSPSDKSRAKVMSSRESHFEDAPEKSAGRKNC